MKIIIYLTLVLVANSCLNKTNKHVKHIAESSSIECGPRCLQMILNYHGKQINFDDLAKKSKMDSLEGTSVLDLTEAVKFYNFESLVVRLPYSNDENSEVSLENVPLPGILHWQGNYFVVLEKIYKDKAIIIHPRLGRLTLEKKQFQEKWLEKDSNTGIIMLLEEN